MYLDAKEPQGHRATEAQGSRAAELWQLRAAGCSRCMCVLEVDPVNTSKLCAATWSVHAGNPGLRFSGSPKGEAITVRAAGEPPPSCRDAAVAADTRPPPRSTGSAGGTTKRSSGLGHLRPVSGDTPEQMKTNKYREKGQCAREGAADRLRRTRDGREGVADGEWHAQEGAF